MQVNVLGAERRRRWSYDEKVRLVEETLQAGETVCGVARRHGVAHSLLFTWRRQARQGRLGGDAVPALVPVEITPAAAPASISTSQLASSPPAPRARAGIIDSGTTTPPRLGGRDERDSRVDLTTRGTLVP
ncbi:IS66-like element accessory protein TnpA, partial [Bradyrhizobium japonicum]|uniref:IS66-like element accessory protein TnpA n=2 Tax=Bradyrhizobium TaxID=374 RepID=UPI0009B7CE3C